MNEFIAGAKDTNYIAISSELRKINTVLDIPTCKSVGKIANATIYSQSLIVEKIRENHKIDRNSSFR